MLDAGERIYAYAKACGNIGKSFIGKRIRRLAGLRTLTELDRLVFPDQRHDLPGRELLVDLEDRFVNRTIASICAVINSYNKPPQALIRLLRSFEYADLKTCLHYLAEGKKSIPAFSGIGGFGLVKFDKYPDLRLMLEDTEYDFLLDRIPDELQGSDSNLAVLETELDMRYYLLLKESLYDLSLEDRKIACMILGEEISLRNCVWAFRLRSYFNMSQNETGKHLMDISMRVFPDELSIAMFTHREHVKKSLEVSLAAQAFESLDFPLDERSAWHGWRWEKLLNPVKPDRLWQADPRYFQNAASYYLYRLAVSHFHHKPFSVSAIFCFIKIKQFEEDLLTSVSEGFSLGLSPTEVFSLLGVSL